MKTRPFLMVIARHRGHEFATPATGMETLKHNL